MIPLKFGIISDGIDEVVLFKIQIFGVEPVLNFMLHQSWHDLHEIAGFVAAIKLEFQNAVPGVLAGAW